MSSTLSSDEYNPSGHAPVMHWTLRAHRTCTCLGPLTACVPGTDCVSDGNAQVGQLLPMPGMTEVLVRL